MSTNTTQKESIFEGILEFSYNNKDYKIEEDYRDDSTYKIYELEDNAYFYCGSMQLDEFTVEHAVKELEEREKYAY